jgi:hypothetical protein
VNDVFENLDPGPRANIDYREWEPERSALAQQHAVPPHRRRSEDQV